MRVGVLIDRWEPARGGAERALALLVRHLLDAGDEVLVYGLSAEAQAPGAFRPVDLPKLPRGKLERALAARSLDLADDDGCDRVVAVRHTPRADAYWPHGGLHRATLRAGEAARSGFSRGIARLLHGFSAKHRAFLDLEADLLARGGAGRVWCVSDMIRRELEEAVPACAGRLEVHANGVDRGTFHPDLRATRRERVAEELDIGLGDPVLLFLGGNWQLKGWFVLFEALRRATHLQWTCIAAGARERAIAWSLKGTPLESRVRVLPRQDARDLYAVADVLLQPTFRDPCSLATLEALSAGIPVLTTDANGAADALRESDAGQVVPAGAWAPFAEALDAWIERVGDEGRRRACGEAARAATEGRDQATWLRGLRSSLAAATTSSSSRPSS